jgi:glycosyltransferase involved in cell wall biosynthesis
MTEVCVVGTALNPVPTEAAWSGIESLVTYMVKGFVELGVNVTLVSVKGSLWRDWDKINLIEVPVSGSDPEKSFFDGYKNEIKDFDCVIDHSNGKRARRANRHIINVSHWLQHPYSMGYRNVVCISKAHARWTKAQYPFKGRGPQVVYNGIDPSMFPLWENKKGGEFLFFSVLGPYKGADTVLKLAVEHPEYRFGFGGRNTDYTKTVREAAEKHENITLYGEVSHEDKKKIMGQAKCLLQLPKPHNPYEQYPFMDIFPMTIIESNLTGTPSIGLAHGGVPEMIESGVNGYLCDNLEGVIEAMGKVDELNPYKCRVYAESRFNHIRMARDYLNLIDRVIERDWW